MHIRYWNIAFFHLKTRLNQEDAGSSFQHLLIKGAPPLYGLAEVNVNTSVTVLRHPFQCLTPVRLPFSGMVKSNKTDATYRLVSRPRPRKLPYVMLVMLLLQRTRFRRWSMSFNVPFPSWVMLLSHMFLEWEIEGQWGKVQFRWNFRCYLMHLENFWQSLAQIFTF